MRRLLLSYIYILSRALTIYSIALYRFIRGEGQDLETAILFGEKGLKALNKPPLSLVLFSFRRDPLEAVKLYDLTFGSSITFSSFQGDLNQLDIWLKMGLGGGCFKTILEAPRAGNPRPRIQQVRVNGDIALLNAYGLPGKGVTAFLEEVSVSPVWRHQQPLGFSVGGESVAEYLSVFETIEQHQKTKTQGPYYFELNISCPNTDEGQNLLKNPDKITELVRDMRLKTQAMIVVKVSPDQPNADLLTIAESIREIPKIAMNIGNTQFKICTALGLPSDALSRGGGGLSGAPLFKRTMEMVTILKPLKLPLIATGGVTTRHQAEALKVRGATLVGVGTGLIQNPYAFVKP